MAGQNQVTLTFAGDTTQLTKAFDNVGKSADKMNEKIVTTGEKTDALATKTGTASGAFGALGSGFQLLGVDSGPALAAVSGLQLGFDALSGSSDLITLALESQRLAKIKDTAATIAHTVATKAAAVGSAIWTGAQWLLNAALDANPIGLIVLAIAALIAIVVLIATKTDWFSKGWKAAWSGIKAAAKAVADWFTGPFVGFFTGAWDKIKGAGEKVWDWIKGLPGKLKSAFVNVASIISAPWRAGFNFIADAWNNTVGKLHFQIPSWVPGIGGKGFDVPDLPHFHTGGVVPGAPGSEMLAVLQAGETVTPAGRSGGSTTVYAGDALTSLVMAMIRDQVGSRFGGNVTLALGGDR